MMSTAASTSRPWPASACWKICAAPVKPVTTEGGMPISRSAARIAATASPSATPGGVLKPITTAGSWPWWLTFSGPERRSMVAIAESGTSRPVLERM